MAPSLPCCASSSQCLDLGVVRRSGTSCAAVWDARVRVACACVRVYMTPRYRPLLFSAATNAVCFFELVLSPPLSLLFIRFHLRLSIFTLVTLAVACLHAMR